MSGTHLGIVMATRREAAPFIEGLGLTAMAGAPGAWFGNGGIVLAVAGVGKTAAAMAATLLIERHAPRRLLNLGAAGATDDTNPVGTILQIERIIEPDRPDLKDGSPSVTNPATLAGFPGATLATHDRPIITDDERRACAPLAALVDMEAAAVVQVCRAYGVDCHCFKIVTDAPGHGLDDIIRALAERCRELFAFYRERLAPLLPRP